MRALRICVRKQRESVAQHTPYPDLGSIPTQVLEPATLRGRRPSVPGSSRAIDQRPQWADLCLPRLLPSKHLVMHFTNNYLIAASHRFDWVY